MELKYDLVVVGGGPAGLAAAETAEEYGVDKILLLERDKFLGGILPQCIHNGFGLEYFGEELTGPEYAHNFIDKLNHSNINVMRETMVIDITPDKKIIAVNRNKGVLTIMARAVVLAMGCRERTREAIKIPGDRPAGIFTAGTAQRYTNIEGFIPGKNVIILGSGDIGLIMARRMTLEGASVQAVLEILPYSSGLIRNKVQCLDDFDIPLKLNHTITRIEGKERVESVFVTEVDNNLQPLPETTEEIACDTVLLSVGLIPENELSKGMDINLHQVTGGPVVNEYRETEIEGVFACGNVLQVHDLVDYVTEEAEITGRAVSIYLEGKRKVRQSPLTLKPGKNINYIVPSTIDHIEDDRKRIKLFMRATKPMENVDINLTNSEGDKLLSYRKDIVTPGEMVTINLPEAIIEEDMKEINISIEKKEGDSGDRN